MYEKVSIAIVGAGPAGIAAAVYLKRAGLEPLVFDEHEPGGLLREANLVENYPGFPDGIAGRDLASLLFRHMTRLGVRFEKKSVVRVTRKESSFTIETTNGAYAAQAVIVATGTTPRKASIEGLERIEASRIHYGLSSLADIEVEEERVAVLGGGDAALDYAINLRERGNTVTVISRSTPTSLPLLLDRARAKGISVLAGCSLQRVDSSSDGISITYRTGSETETLLCDLIVIAHGREPRLEALDDGLRRAVLEAGEVHPSTGIEGLYVIGDVIRGRHRQTAIAVGDGVLAAMRIQESFGSGGAQK